MSHEGGRVTAKLLKKFTDPVLLITFWDPLGTERQLTPKMCPQECISDVMAGEGKESQQQPETCLQEHVSGLTLPT